MSTKTVYITSRGGTHPIHKSYADSVNSDYQYVDFFLRWHDVPAPTWKRYLSWLVCAWTFPNRKSYDIFITGGQQFPAVLMKKMRRVSAKKKIVCLHSNETLYFLYAKRYSRLTSIALKWLLQQYDYHICTSQMQTQLLQRVTGMDLKNIFTTFNGVSNDRMVAFQKISPNLRSYHILLIGNLYSGWRLWYKGIDLMIQSVLDVMNKLPIHFTIVGQLDVHAEQELKQKFDKEKLNKITFAGKTRHLKKYLEQSALYLHCARGEAFGISTIEAMAAGLPTIVSEWTGTKDIVMKVEPALIVPLESKAIAEKIQWYFNLSLKEKEILSAKSRAVSQPYTENAAINSFKQIMRKIEQL